MDLLGALDARLMTARFIMWSAQFGKACRLSLVVLGLVVGNLWAADEQLEGTRLAQQVHDRPAGRDSSVRGFMILTEKGHESRVRRMISYRLDQGGGNVWSLVRFTMPQDINGVGLLTKNYPGNESEQWLYLPALGRARRISSARKGGRLVGSDFYYEDMRDRDVNLDRHRLLGQEKIGGALCKVLETVPVAPDSSVYSKRISWIHPQTLIPLQVDFYVAGQEGPIKRLKVYRIQRIQGYWTATDTVITDLESGHQTRMRTEKIVYDRNLSDRLFSRQFLTDPAKEAPYRP